VLFWSNLEAQRPIGCQRISKSSSNGSKAYLIELTTQDRWQAAPRNGREIGHASFHSDVDKLIRGPDPIRASFPILVDGAKA
jgi:hypothetical protein